VRPLIVVISGAGCEGTLVTGQIASLGPGLRWARVVAPRWWITVLGMLLWTDPRWLAEAHTWIRERLDALDVRPIGDIEQPHVRPWSTVMRVSTSGGDLWFKANVPALAYEAGVVGVLARTRPDLVQELAAVDLERGWMLMRDGGERLRELIERERDLERWLKVLPLYGELQLSTASSADELVRLGVPDRRLAILPGQYERLIEELEGLTHGERDRLRAHVPNVAEMCRELSTVAIPETIQHDDLHDAQVFVREGRYVFFDWGDSCVSHPFFSMSVTLEGQLAWGLDDVEDSVDVTPFRDAYLRSFTSFAGRAELEAAHATALRLGWVCRAVNVRRFAVSLDLPDRQEWAERVRLRLQMFLGSSPRTNI
jgi:hypothetical protein